MTIQELYDYLKNFIKKHPQCKDEPIMVKNMNDESTWEEVTLVSDTVVDSCPEYGSPLYFHSKSQEEITEKYNQKLNDNDDDEIEYLI